MTLESSVAEHLLDIKKKKQPHPTHLRASPVPQEEGDSRIYC